MSEGRRARKPAGADRRPVGARFKLKNAIAVGVVAVAITAAGMMALCGKKKPAPDKNKKPAVTCVQKKCDKKHVVDPKKNDGKCEMAKGEHDPYSPLYDDACGYCGDGKQQSWETKDNCPIDFLCKSGEKGYWRQWFAKFKPGDDGKLKLVTVKITKRCNKSDRKYNRATSSKKGMSTRKKDPKDPMVAEVARPVVKEGGPCKRTGNPNLGAIESSIRSKIKMRTSRIWGTFKVPKEKDSKAHVRLNISSGKITSISVKVRWKGGSRSIPASRLGLRSLVGRSIGYQPIKTKCFLMVYKDILSLR